MDVKAVFFVFFLISIVSASPKPQGKVQIPFECAQACPHHDGNMLCARNTVTGQLGTFESDCVLGRYNSCIRTGMAQKYEFVKYGEC